MKEYFCKYCGASLSKNADICIECREPVIRKKIHFKRYIAIGLAVILSVYGIIKICMLPDNLIGGSVVISAAPFSDGVALVKYRDGGLAEIFARKKIGVINKLGEVLFSYRDSEIENISNFENGVALLSYSDGSSKIINKNGDTVYKANNDIALTALGGGYFLRKQSNKAIDKDSDFSANGYSLLDNSGNQLEIPKKFLQQELCYCGENIFSICEVQGSKSIFDTTSTYAFYNLSEKREFKCENVTPEENVVFKFCGGKALTYIDNGDLTYRPVILTSTGEIISLNYDGLQGRLKCGPIADGGLVLSEYIINRSGNDYIKKIQFYVIDSGRLTPINVDCKKVGIDAMEKLKYDSGILSLQYREGDNIKLFFVDKTGNVAADIKVKSCLPWNGVINEKISESGYIGTFSGGRMAVDIDNGHWIIDNMGKCIFKLETYDVSVISEYSEGAAIIGGKRYVNTNGELLFKTLKNA